MKCSPQRPECILIMRPVPSDFFSDMIQLVSVSLSINARQTPLPDARSRRHDPFAAGNSGTPTPTAPSQISTDLWTICQASQIGLVPNLTFTSAWDVSRQIAYGARECSRVRFKDQSTRKSPTLRHEQNFLVTMDLTNNNVFF